MNTLQATFVTALSFILLIALAIQGPIVYSELENRARVEFAFVREWLSESCLFESKVSVYQLRNLGRKETVTYENLSTNPEKLLQLIDLARDLTSHFGAVR